MLRDILRPCRGPGGTTTSSSDARMGDRLLAWGRTVRTSVGGPSGRRLLGLTQPCGSFEPGGLCWGRVHHVLGDLLPGQWRLRWSVAWLHLLQRPDVGLALRVSDAGRLVSANRCRCLTRGPVGSHSQHVVATDAVWRHLGDPELLVMTKDHAGIVLPLAWEINLGAGRDRDTHGYLDGLRIGEFRPEAGDS